MKPVSGSPRPLNHPVECYGYRIEQHDKPGTLDAAQLIAEGVPPGPLFHRLKLGLTVELEDGRLIDGSRYLGPVTPGKKLAIFGDTAPCPEALELARGVDVMVHEVTLEQAMAEKANGRGHSSSQQTAALAREAGVGTLIATHFSSRYDAEGCHRLLAECREVFPLPCWRKIFWFITSNKNRRNAGDERYPRLRQKLLFNITVITQNRF